MRPTLTTAGTNKPVECSKSARAGQLVLPATVAVEAAWLIGSRLGPSTEAAFVASIAAGDFTVADLTPVDWSRCAELTEQYLDLDLGLVDASVVAIAERLQFAACPLTSERWLEPAPNSQPGARRVTRRQSSMR